MLTEEQGNLLDAPADALVNTVNTVGVMGKGLALQFKKAYPGNFRASTSQPRDIGARSQLSDIVAGLADLRRVIRDCGIRSIAIPSLGCGNDGLNWQDVHPLIIESLGDLPGVHVMVFPPEARLQRSR